MCKGPEAVETERIPRCLEWSEEEMRQERQAGLLKEALETTERNLVFV